MDKRSSTKTCLNNPNQNTTTMYWAKVKWTVWDNVHRFNCQKRQSIWSMSSSWKKWKTKLLKTHLIQTGKIVRTMNTLRRITMKETLMKANKWFLGKRKIIMTRKTTKTRISETLTVRKIRKSIIDSTSKDVSLKKGETMKWHTYTTSNPLATTKKIVMTIDQHKIQFFCDSFTFFLFSFLIQS